jgi:hypothetical protein
MKRKRRRGKKEKKMCNEHNLVLTQRGFKWLLIRKGAPATSISPSIELGLNSVS